MKIIDGKTYITTDEANKGFFGNQIMPVTLEIWRKNPNNDKGFPQPLLIEGTEYWDVEQVRSYLAAQRG